MEIDVGMYVRVKELDYTIIAKIIAIQEDGFNADNDMYYLQDNVLKASYNIIDLIKENDYIRIISSSVFEHVYYSYGKLVIKDDVQIENYSNEFIAEVITYEQMKSISYEVN